jgi:hypothetical protein
MLVCNYSASLTMASLMRRPKPFRRKNAKTLNPTPDEEQAPVTMEPIGRHTVDLMGWVAPRRPRSTGGLYLRPQPLLTLPGKRVFTQVSPSKLSSRPRQNFSSSYASDTPGHYSDVEYLPLSQGLHVTSDPFAEVTHEITNGKKRKKQWHRWSQEVIPSLLNPYFRYLRLSQSLKTRPEIVETFCSSACNSRHLTVTLVTFEGMSDIFVDTC